MIFKCKKIRNVDKSVCTGEQVIAYNYAFMYYGMGSRILESNTAEFVKSEGFNRIEQLVIDSIRSKPELSKYNVDVIMVAFRQGFRKYCEKHFIATNYEKIGECFTFPYQIV